MAQKMVEQNWRVWVLGGCCLVFALVLVGRLFAFQILAGDRFVEQANDQYVRPNYDHEVRGDIYFQLSNGELMPLATTLNGYLLAVDPDQVSDPEALWQAISQLDRDLSPAKFQKLLEKDSSYVRLVDKLSRQEKEQLQQQELDGVFFKRRSWRYYPGDEIASHVVGLVAYEGDDKVGQYGLERQYEDVLQRSSLDKQVNLFAEIFANLSYQSESQEPEGEIVTTLDPVVQAQAEEQLNDLVERYQIRQGGIIIMDPQSGAVTAMASQPNFDPNEFSRAEGVSFSNPNVDNLYEMGSIVKPLTIAAGLDIQAITPESEYYDSGQVEVDGYTIYNHDGRGRGYIDMQQVLNDSVNTGVVHVVDMMGTSEFADYMKNFGLAGKTGIDLPHESESNLRGFDSPRQVEYATASFGQGIAVTPISMIRALAVLANGGRVVTPHVVERIEYQNGEVEEVTPSVVPSVITAQTSETISRMLVNTVDEALLSGEVKKDRYSIAAKTGTAQIADREIGGYRSDAYLHSFFGYFPAYDPRFIILVYGLEPEGVQYASRSMTPAFMSLVDFLINHYDIAPDR